MKQFFLCVDNPACGFPHPYGSPNNCPQCGRPGIDEERGMAIRAEEMERREARLREALWE